MMNLQVGVLWVVMMIGTLRLEGVGITLLQEVGIILLEEVHLLEQSQNLVQRIRYLKL
ncbi:hypothetical protein D3C76_1511590 [compost metagenome]